MMELQGAIGLAQLAKLDSIVAAQQKNKATLMQAAAGIPGVVFRELVDADGDSATFLSFTLQDRQHCQQVNESLRKSGHGAINFAENSWHFYPKWEHLLGGKTLTKSGYPFSEPNGKRRIVYDPALLPQSAALLERTLVYPVAIKMSDEKLSAMCGALKDAQKV